WLETLLASTADDSAVDWVFAFLHHPGRSEIWPDGNTAWVQDQVIPLLNRYDKVELLTYGHSHNYERGATTDGNLRLMLSGGGGGALDRWGMYSNQVDYPEIHRSRDHYGYTLVEIDCAGSSYTAQSYSLGHLDLPLDNVLIDSFTRDRNSPIPETPTALAPASEVPAPATLTASPFTANQPIMSAQFELTAIAGDWSSPLIADHRDWENIYWDTGAPDYEPVDLNELVDLTRLTIANGILTSGTPYWWRIRYRDQNLQWSAWSEAATFSIGDVPLAAAFTADVTVGTPPLAVRFTDLSLGTPIDWHWDLDGDGQEDSNTRDPIWTYTEAGDYSITLTVDYSTGSESMTIPGYISVSNPTGAPQEADTCFTVDQNFPNPFNPLTTVCYIIPEAATVTVDIINIRGHLVRRFDFGRQPAGQHSLVWDGRDGDGFAVSSGVYFYRVSAGGFTRTMKAILMR
ncbi:MAG: T9SS type A sorting domain-containing protein, partial [Planctomycetes bacterium]|nr:T9SS type A sorting domain-containing protein [Planctomycetota bacterium]